MMDHWLKRLAQDVAARLRWRLCRFVVACFALWLVCIPIIARPVVLGQFSDQVGLSTEARRSPGVIPSPVPNENVGIRITWGAPQRFDFDVEIASGGSFVEPIRQLGIDPDDSGEWISTSPDSLRLTDRNALFGGGDVRWKATSDASIKIVVRSQRTNERDKQAPVVKEFAWEFLAMIDQLVNGPIDLPLHDGATLRVDRIPGDSLSVVSQQTSWVLSSGSLVEFQIAPTALPWREQMGKLDVKLARSGSDEVLWEASHAVSLNHLGSAEGIAIRTNAPDNSGVYEFRCTLTPKRFLSTWTESKSQVQRVVQFVVFDDKANGESKLGRAESDPVWEWTRRVHAQTSTLRATEHSDPIRVKAAERWKATRKWFSRGAGNSLEPFLIPPNESIRIPLKCDAAGRVVSIQFGIDGWWQQAQVRVWDSAENPRLLVDRQWRPRMDELVRILESSAVSDEVEWPRSVSFLPSTKEVVVEIVNRSLTESLRIGSAIAETHSVTESAVQAPSANGAEGALAANSFSNTGRSCYITEVWSTQDWRDILELGKRITGNAADSWESMDIALRAWFLSAKRRGVQQVSLPVLSKGSTLYPTRKLVSKPWLQTGLFSDKGVDPVDKDVVRYLYRLSDEFGIAFLPLFELNFPLGQFQHFKRDDLESLLFIGGNGDPISARRNPLSAASARCLQELWLEFENEYQDEPGYNGYAVVIDSSSQLSIPRDWSLLADPILDLLASSLSGNVPRSRTERLQVFETINEKTFDAWQLQQVVSHIEGLGRQLKRVYIPSATSFGGLKTKRLEIATIEQGNDLSGRDMLAEWWLSGPASKSFRPPAFGNEERKYVLGHFSVPSMDWFATAKIVPRVVGQPTLERIKIWQKSDEAGERHEAFLINATPWHCRLEVAWGGVPSELQATPVGGNRFQAIGERIVSGDARELLLPPYSGWVLQWSGSQASMVQWQANQEGAVDRMDQMLRSLDQSVTNLSSAGIVAGLLENEDIELPSSSKGNEIAAGWVASMNPKASVVWRPGIGFAGGSGLKIEFQLPGEAAWVQSDSFESDRNRLRLQMHIAESNGQVEKATATLLVWNPSTNRFEPGPAKAIVPKSDFGDGGWREWSADFTNELSAKWSDGIAHIFKLQLDIEGKGEIQLDAIRASGDFLVDSERADLRNRTFSAKRAWTEGNGDPALKLLEANWSRLLRAHPAAVVLQGNEKVTQGAKQIVAPNRSTSRQVPPNGASKSATRRWRIFDR
ncbi:hypothetical protein SH501x_004882 [Pirellulaceae bacterium SH501]